VTALSSVTLHPALLSSGRAQVVEERVAGDVGEGAVVGDAGGEVPPDDDDRPEAWCLPAGAGRPLLAHLRCQRGDSLGQVVAADLIGVVGEAAGELAPLERDLPGERLRLEQERGSGRAEQQVVGVSIADLDVVANLPALLDKTAQREAKGCLRADRGRLPAPEQTRTLPSRPTPPRLDNLGQRNRRRGSRLTRTPISRSYYPAAAGLLVRGSDWLLRRVQAKRWRRGKHTASPATAAPATGSFRV
jgi:hypothetical protein